MTRAPNEPAKLTSGTVEMPANDTSRSNVIATIAPSDAPADTPSVSGEASGLGSSAWNTTPDSASALPTSAAAITRGRRATKKICASVLLAYGIDRSKTVPRWIRVLPTSGASSSASAASVPNAAMVKARRRRIDVKGSARGELVEPRARPSTGSGRAVLVLLRSANRHHRHMARPRVELHVRLDPVQLPDPLGRQNLGSRSLRDHPPFLE